MSDPIQSLWIGERLSTMERLAVASFLANGHEFHLYVYSDVANIPPGTTVRDGNEILPSSMIFQYRDRPSYSGFSNYFRYKLLLDRGGWWVDTDLICLRPFVTEDEYVFASEPGKEGDVICAGAIKTPPGSEAMQWAWDVCRAKDPASLRWGETGPALVAETVARFGLARHVLPSTAFCAIRDGAWSTITAPDAPVLPADAFGIHLWNERWRRNGHDKDGEYPGTSLYEGLKRRYLG